jgi:arylsulfatase A-like enzyme
VTPDATPATRSVRSAVLRLSAAVLAAAFAALGVMLSPSRASVDEPPAQRPNVLLIITDDQRDGDASMRVMPQTTHLFGDEGTEFSNAYVTTPLCCPSRASIFTGQYVHNHRVVNNHRDLSHPERTWQRHLDEAGYETALYGKYLNSWMDRKPSVPIPYFDESWQGYSEQHDKNPVDSEEFLAGRAIGFLERAQDDDSRPWAMVISTRSPHAPYAYPDRFHRDVGRFRPRPSVRDDLSDKPRYVRQTARKRRRQIRTAPRRHKARWIYTGQLRELLAVDEMVDRVFERMRSLDEDEDTLAIFVSDNGHFWGEHSLPSKQFPYREAVEVPLYVRWPGRVAAGEIDRRLVANIDLAPTIMGAAGVAPEYRADGRSLLDPGWRRRWLLLEGPGRRWQSYLRRHKQYIRWATGFREYYDLRRDRFQEHNALAPRADLANHRGRLIGRQAKVTVPRSTARRKAARMQAALNRVAHCAGRACP